MKINKLWYHYVEDYDFYRVDYELDYVFHRVQLSSWIIKQTGLTVPDAIAHLLRAEYDCVPEERVFR